MLLASILKWMFSEAGAGWIFGLVSVSVLIISYVRRMRPQKLIVREVKRINPVRIRSTIKDRVKITFDGDEVEKLSQIELEILNDGTNVINEGSLSLVLPKANKILDGSFDESGSTDHNLNMSTKGNKAIIKWNYINPYRDHKHKIRISLVISGETNRIEIHGSGKGWSASHLKLPTRKQARRTHVFMLLIMLSFLPCLFAYAFLIEKMFDIPGNEVSLRSFLAYLPLIILMITVLCWLFMKEVQLSRAID